MKKRTMVLLLCIALASLVAVNDTLASTVTGWFRNVYDALGNLVDSPTTGVTLDVEIDTRTSGILSPIHYEGAFTWEKADDAVVSKTTCVQNIQQEAAYVRLCIAVKTADCLQMKLNTVPAEYRMATNNIHIGGKPFTLYNFDYPKELLQGETSPAIIMDFALVKETNNEDLAVLGNDFVQMQVFAIQASAFQQMDEEGKRIARNDVDTAPMKPETALKIALGDIENFNPFQ